MTLCENSSLRDAVIGCDMCIFTVHTRVADPDPHGSGSGLASFWQAGSGPHQSQNSESVDAKNVAVEGP
jgi:hypothetical protein